MDSVRRITERSIAYAFRFCRGFCKRDGRFLSPVAVGPRAGVSGQPSERDQDVLIAAARAVIAAFRLQLEAQHLPVRAAAALHLLEYALQPWEERSGTRSSDPGA